VCVDCKKLFYIVFITPSLEETESVFWWLFEELKHFRLTYNLKFGHLIGLWLKTEFVVLIYSACRMEVLYGPHPAREP
jgi:hypothetical protein